MSTQTQVKEAEQLELDLPIKFNSVQYAAEWLRDKARRDGVDEAIIADIEAIGTCDQQSKTRVERYCAEMDLVSSNYTW